MRLAPLLLGAPSGGDLHIRPLISPVDPPLADHVVGATRKLPVADRWGQGWPAVALRELPLRRTERRNDFAAATARAHMPRHGKLFRDVQNARRKLARQVLHASRSILGAEALVADRTLHYPPAPLF
jgi:hypothetical protein